MAIEKQIELTTVDKISAFITKNRLVLIIIAAVIVIGIAATWITISILDSSLEKNISQVELYQERFRELAINPDSLSEEAIATAWRDYETELQDFIDSTRKSYPELRAMFLLASVAYQLDEYSLAMERFNAVVANYPDSHLAATSLMNSAVASEEAGDIAAALDSYTELTETYLDRSFEVPHAYFNIGRLLEQQEKFDDAIEIYRTLSIDFPNSEWSNLAISRLIVLEQ